MKKKLKNKITQKELTKLRHDLEAHEIFRRIYQLPKFTAEKKLLSYQEKIKKFLKEHKINLSHIYNKWKTGLKEIVHTDNDFRNIFDKYFNHNFKDEIVLLSKENEKIRNEIEDLPFDPRELLNNRLIILTQKAQDPNQIKQEYEEKIRQLQESYDKRLRFVRDVFESSSLRFARFLKSKDKQKFLNRKERIAVDEIEKSTGKDSQELIDEIIQEIPYDLYIERKRIYKKEYERRLKEYDQYLNEINQLGEELEKLDGYTSENRKVESFI